MTNAACLALIARTTTIAAALLAAAILAFPPTAPAQPTPAVTPSADDEPSTREEILRSLKDVQQKYGGDAVMLEGHLLGHAIQGGSILEAVISIPGIEEYAGKRFLAFTLETGIVYNDHELVTAARRHARAWKDIVEMTLKKFQTLTVPADGLLLTLSWSHKPYADETELRAHLKEDRGQAEMAKFYLLTADITELITRRISGQQLVDRSTVLVDGAPAHLVLDDEPLSTN